MAADGNQLIGSIMIFAGNFAPRGWAYCDGQLLSINANQALYSILGTTYGGDGRTTFGLPDLRGRLPVGPRHGPGLSNYMLGERGGQEIVAMNTTQIPSHNHQTVVTQGAAYIPVNTTEGDEDEKNPGAGVMAAPGKDLYSSTPNGTYGAASPVSGTTVHILNNGGSIPHNNIQPFLSINYIIALVGLYPSRN